MSRKWTTWLASLALAGTLAIPMVTVAQAPAPGTPQAPRERGERGEGRERHPAIHQAMRALEHAKMILQKDASRDFDGHRANAVKEIDEALGQLRQALQADKQ